MHIQESSERFINYCANVKQLSEHTLRAYEIDLESFIAFAGVNKSIFEINRNDFHDYLQHLYTVCELKQSSAKRRFACLKSLFQWLEYQDLIDESPFRKARISIRLPSTLPKGLTLEEIKKLIKTITFSLNHFDSDDWLDERSYKLRQLITLVSVQLLFATGIRVAELCSITLDDIDLTNGVIKIHGKGDRERLVFMTGDALIRLLKVYLNTRLIVAPNHNTLMINTRGKVANTQYIRLLIKKVAEEAGIKRRITPHMLRHSTATHLLNNGMDIRFVQRLLGHQSIITTQIYAHVNTAKLQQSVLANHPLALLN